LLQVMITFEGMLKSCISIYAKVLIFVKKICIFTFYIKSIMEITGKVHEIGAVQQVTETFKKRDLVIEYAENPQYPEFIKFEATQDRVNLFDNLSSGDEVAVSFNLRGRPWTNKEGVTTYFNSLVAWRVNK